MSSIPERSECSGSSFGLMNALCKVAWFLSAVSLSVIVASHLHAERNVSVATESPSRQARPCSSEIELPSNWRVDVVGREFGGWRQIGVAPLCFEDAVEEVSAIMREHGYTKENVVSEDSGGHAGVLVRFTSADAPAVMWSLRESGNLSTEFSWGREKE